MTTSTTKGMTIGFLAAMAVMISVTAGVVSTLPSSDPAWKAPTQFGRPPVASMVAKDRHLEQRSEAQQAIGAMQASRLLPCMMPRAWQRDCQASTAKIAAN